MVSASGWQCARVLERATVQFRIAYGTWKAEHFMTAHLVKAATKLNNIDSKKFTHLPVLPIICVLLPLEEDSEVNMASVSFFNGIKI